MKRIIALLGALMLTLAFATPAHATTYVTQGYYQMNEAAHATVLVDSSGLSHNGTIGSEVSVNPSTGTHSWLKPAPTTKQDNNRLDQVPTTAGLPVPGSHDFQITVKFRTDQSGNCAKFVGWGQSPKQMFKMDNCGGLVACNWIGSSATNSVETTTVGQYNDANWHVATCTKNLNQIYVTVDGVQGPVKSVTIGNVSPTLPFSIGGKASCNPPTVDCDYYTGYMDYVLVQIAP